MARPLSLTPHALSSLMAVGMLERREEKVEKT